MPEIKVNVPATVVNVPETVVNVNVPKSKPIIRTVERDKENRVARIIETSEEQ